MSDHIPDTGEMVPEEWVTRASNAASRAASRQRMDVHHGELLNCVRAALAAVAPMIAAAERERCARVAHQHGYDLANLDERNGAFSAAAAIRALGDKA